jgi:hypothetical protein
MEARQMNDEIKCPKCGALEVESESPHTFYKCQSYDYDQRPETFFQSEYCKEQCSANQQPTTEKPSVLPKCESGCKVFTGGEIKHHEDCVFYPESLTKLNADIIATQQSEIDRLTSSIQVEKKWRKDADEDIASLKAALSKVAKAFPDDDYFSDGLIGDALKTVREVLKPTPNPNGHE